MSVNADILSSTQALYAAEGAAENYFSIVSTGDNANRNIKFLTEKDITVNDKMEEFLPYNEESNSFYIEREMSLNASDLNTADAHNSNNRVVTSNAYLADGQTMDQKAFYGLEPRKARGFVLREVDEENNFNEIIFEYNQDSEDSDLLFEVLVFPQEGSTIDFLDFDSLKNGFESSVKRFVINTRDSSAVNSFDAGDHILTADIGGTADNYKNQIHIHGFQPVSSVNNYNYILYYYL